MILQLTKQSTDQEIKAYFEEVLKLSKDSEEFPVNLDDVWPLVYSSFNPRTHTGCDGIPDKNLIIMLQSYKFCDTLQKIASLK